MNNHSSALEHKKRLLYFIPFNIMKSNSGAVTRAWELLKAFRSAHCVVDYVHSADTWGAPMSREEVEAMKNTELVRQVYSLVRKPKATKDIIAWLYYRIQRLGRDLSLKRSIGNFVTSYNRKLFNKILSENTYDYIIISYAHWAHFIKNNKHIGNARLIIDTHDFLTAQESVWKHFNIGQAFRDEMKRISFFDKVWAISQEECYLFQQFTNKEVILVPFCTEDHSVLHTDEPRAYDMIYVAGDNRHNIQAAQWFFNEVFPLLRASVRCCVVGTINNHVPSHENIYKVSYTVDLGKYYSQAKLAICPMLTGTGVKIKVIEALSYGLPVVCSPRGVDGLVNKVSNGCIIADTPYQFKKTIENLLSNTVYYEKNRSQAITYFRENHSVQQLQSKISMKLN